MCCSVSLSSLGGLEIGGVGPVERAGGWRTWRKVGKSNERPARELAETGFRGGIISVGRASWMDKF